MYKIFTHIRSTLLLAFFKAFEPVGVAPATAILKRNTFSHGTAVIPTLKISSTWPLIHWKTTDS